MKFMKRMEHRRNTAGLLHAAWIIIPFAMILTNCASAPRPVSSSTATPAFQTTPRRAPLLEQRLRATVHQWRGTPHRMGGTDRSGVDCSGFVQQVYNDVFGIRLPRTTAGQVHHGVNIATSRLRPGDLVFFLPTRTLRHVGIYLGDGQFAHASKTKGVMISRIDEPYWRKAYWTARRVLPDNT
jgi:cell wall-associated NlpC family hydrolase